MTIAVESDMLLNQENVVRYIVIHHSLTKDGIVNDWEAIRKYHIKTNGWRDIGYHFGVELYGGEYVLRYGRPVPFKGAHVGDGGFNDRSIGVCVVGNFDLETVPPDQWKLATKLVAYLRKSLGIPKNLVVGHGEAQALVGIHVSSRKSCPGKLFNMDTFRAEI